MYDLYYAPTPNGWKITIFMHEAELDYNLVPVDIRAGDQFKPEFLAIGPNNRMPVLVDSEGPDGKPISLFESGAILQYLAEKTGQFLPKEPAERYRAMCWLYWQMGGLGPMAGQLSHFVNYAPAEGNEYSRDRYAREYDRLFAVMDRQLQNNEWLGGDQYSIADMASFPWVLPYKRFEQPLDSFSHLSRWYETMKERPAVQTAVDIGRKALEDAPKMTEEEKKTMFGQSSKNLSK